MKLLHNLFNRKKKLVNSPELKICIIDDTTTDMWVTFGITKERRDELIDICDYCINQFDGKSEAYAYIVDKCKHVNEVVTATIVFERMCAQANENPIASLMKLFGR
jgi:hypothetical protein